MELQALYRFARNCGASLFRHRRRKTVDPYVYIGDALAQCSTYHIVEGDRVAVYLSSEGKLYVRHGDEFTDGRFQKVEE